MLRRAAQSEAPLRLGCSCGLPGLLRQAPGDTYPLPQSHEMMVPALQCGGQPGHC